jgi:hypothetical protein
MSRYLLEQLSIPTHLGLGNSGSDTLKSQSKRLISDNNYEKCANFGWCDCCQAEGAFDMWEELDDIARVDQEREKQRR